MSQYDPTWSYGNSGLFNSSGSTVTDGDDIWDYGRDNLYHEYIAPIGGVVMTGFYYRILLAGDSL